MKQILQNLRSGETAVADAPTPACMPGSLKIRTTQTLISAGTERMLVEFSKGGLLAKAKAQPDKVKQVLDKIKTDGLVPTLETVFSRLDEPLPLGYCNAGVVLEVGSNVTEFKPGDRVASNGPHAEFVCIPKNLCAKIPDQVTDEQAAFTVLSSIGLQGVRLIAPTLGEKVVVYGLGLIGLVTVQLLRASGCEVMGIDINPDRLKIAEGYGAYGVNAAAGGDPISAASAWTDGKGVDGVLITASTKTDEIMHHSAEMGRKRGRIVLVGVVGLNLRRSEFYEKELTFQVSCSYGPGRYDETYEQGGHDYPTGFVRWTEQRNFGAILGALRARQLVVDDLISHRYTLQEAPHAYEKLSADSSALGIMLGYPIDVEPQQTVAIGDAAIAPINHPVLAVIGAGNYSKMSLMPALAKTNARVKYISARTNGAAASHLATRFGIEKATTDLDAVLTDDEVSAVLISTNHNSHARLACDALKAGKHAFVEKPLALDSTEITNLLDAAAQYPDQHIMVGFNRRFSPHTQKSQATAHRTQRTLGHEHDRKCWHYSTRTLGTRS